MPALASELTPKAKHIHAALFCAARQMLGQKGKQGVTVMNVCEHAGVGRTSFYNYFQDVDDLITSIAEETGRAVKA